MTGSAQHTRIFHAGAQLSLRFHKPRQFFINGYPQGWLRTSAEMWQESERIKEDAFIWGHCLNISTCMLLFHMQASAFTPSALPEDCWTLPVMEVIVPFEFSTVIKYGGAQTRSPQCVREFKFLHAEMPHQAQKSIRFWLLVIHITASYSFVFLKK